MNNIIDYDTVYHNIIGISFTIYCLNVNIILICKNLQTLTN
jgi:hypothetical protein